MKLLLIDTTTPLCSVAITENGNLLTIAEDSGDNVHAAQLTLLVQSCLDQARIKSKDINGVAVSAGPGSYTGLRIGISCAKGICHSLNIPLIAVDTLQALALAPKNNNRTTVAMLDARRMDVYASVWTKEGICKMPNEPITLTKEWLQTAISDFGPLAISGDGAMKASIWAEELDIHIYSTTCSVTNLIQLAAEAYRSNNFVDVAYFEPVYLKPPNITMPKIRVE